MLRLICTKCQRKLEKMLSGVYVIEYLTYKLEHAYKIWSADLFKCASCEGPFIVSDFGNGPLKQNHEPDFEEYLKELQTNHPDEIYKFY